LKLKIVVFLDFTFQCFCCDESQGRYLRRVTPDRVLYPWLLIPNWSTILSKQVLTPKSTNIIIGLCYYMPWVFPILLTSSKRSKQSCYYLLYILSACLLWWNHKDGIWLYIQHYTLQRINTPYFTYSDDLKELYTSLC